jgi:bifunctional N-acetylglucosamine-1-phosphate-uridyltransferase/glucosamine-1-phosphate-acetyltransferase GlmU-like protein
MIKKRINFIADGVTGKEPSRIYFSDMLSIKVNTRICLNAILSRISWQRMRTEISSIGIDDLN